MFTGIVNNIGTIQAVEFADAGYVSMTVSHGFDSLVMGESIALNGICLTVVSFDGDSFTAHLSPETIKLTTASSWRLGFDVHMERALCVGDRLGGHWVAGHIDSTVSLLEKKSEAGCLYLRFNGVSESHISLVIEKGSVCLDGISLTINRVFEDGFDVMIIPHTQSVTTLSSKKLGEHLNVEYDQLIKWVSKQSLKKTGA